VSGRGWFPDEEAQQILVGDARLPLL
jgi:hypothetical protein